MKKENAHQGAQSELTKQAQYSTIQPTVNASEPIAMSSREIAKLTGKRHADVMRDTRAMLNEIEKDVSKFAHIYFDAQNREQTEYTLDKELTLTLVSGYSIKLRHAIIKRLDELERASKPQLPRTRTEAIEMMLEQSRMLDHQQAYIEETKDDVEFAQAVSSSKSGVNLEVFGKSVGIGRNKLFSWLRDEKVLMSDPIPKYSKNHNMPYQNLIDAEYFTIKRRVFNTSHGRERSFTPLITGKGELWLTKKLIKAGLIESTATIHTALPHQQ
ncbi:TPA: phage regulatory protein/antirepressor Ant [Vibrio alginolyticus]|uniref:phage regulatory protein/antirepressor Ant n=1 Tax=Vibrio alginolyticus TaxID=663 RepID=UPI00215FAA06|nr:phage regulatory protein/antirepressor Ant [Vibrio alginolyticus]MCS0223028.1 phage regulatory protein/antirepressor Ant [Vibrio alginolyticus]